ncbi:MAG TPA: OB-fold domain-containing protein [Acidimicrobiales bacterium]|nr:OB-fold domain-containing protein [Acidimicrobiales bacterium]
MTAIAPPGPRMLPALDDANRAFYTGGKDGRLLVGRCQKEGCRRWALPPAASCPECGSELQPEPVSGRARVLTWTVNFHPYHPDVPVPYVIALVVLEEQDDLRVATNIVGVAASDDALQIGMDLTVAFEDHGEIFYPVFTPVGAV